MTLFLPVIAATTPFSLQLESELRIFADFSTSSSGPAIASITTVSPPRQARKAWPVQDTSVPFDRNDENRSPCVAHTVKSQVATNLGYSSPIKTKLRQVDGASSQTRVFLFSSPVKAKIHSDSREQGHHSIVQASPHSISSVSTSKENKQRFMCDAPKESPTIGQNAGIARHYDTVQSKVQSMETFPVFKIPELTTPSVSRNIELEQRHNNVLASSAVDSEQSLGVRGSPRRRSRRSEASSDFVHTVRTASMTNGSFSIMPRSMRFGRSSDSQSGLGSYPRYSMDSDRPRTTSSIDEAAHLRGIKRRQILEELTNTEASYVADLKTLVYLYTTLLASTTNISTSVGASIQRNVTSLLHLHETLLDQLKRASYKAAARKWADTASPIRLGCSNYTRGRGAKSHLHSRFARERRQTRSSTDVAEAARSQTRLGSADPLDVLDVTGVFQAILPSFFAYEEYCANHEIVACELHKRTPTLWSTYEAGIESLSHMLTALDHKTHQHRKGITVNDLLIKPIQRICRYPLIFEDLLRQTPSVDSPGVNDTVNTVLQRLREIVYAVNLATDNQLTRVQIQRRWLIQDRLNLSATGISSDQFRAIGYSQLCGVLHVTYQTALAVHGCYALCVLFDHHLLVAAPNSMMGRFDILTIIHLADLNIESAGDGKGIQCQSALHTWKVWFTCQCNIHEILFSACSTAEEQQWLLGLRGQFEPSRAQDKSGSAFTTRTFREFRSLGVVFGPHVPLSRQLSIQRAATVVNRANICQVILRNTHNPEGLQEFRSASPSMVNRSQSHATSNKVVVLAPKRSERTRLESSLNDVWTKDRLPFPGMIANKGSQIIRASAGSLVRKLSLASIHTPFSRRSTAVSSMSSKQSCDALLEQGHTALTRPVDRAASEESTTPIRNNRPKQWAELDTMESVVERMIGAGSRNGKRLSCSGGGDGVRQEGQEDRTRRASTCHVNPDGPIALAAEEEDSNGVVQSRTERHSPANEPGKLAERLRSHGTRNRRKRRSNPISMLKGISSEGFRHILHPHK